MNALTKVGENAYSAGPNCPSVGSEVTFDAETGVVYRIAVDGNGFYLPPASPPAGEGTFVLQIAPTPSPSNDHFANAEMLDIETGEAGVFSFRSAEGTNWNASKEVGEPDHAGNPGGASVWFSWTAPASGVAQVSVFCLGFDALVGVYTGESLATLATVASVSEPPCATSFNATAGIAYRIAIDGKFDTAIDMPAMGDFTVRASMPLPGQSMPADNSGSASPDTTPPGTRLRKRSVKSGKRRATFAFGSNETGVKYRCKLDKRPFDNCRSPKTYRNLKPGRHVFKVVAMDPSGNADPSPAIARFAIAEPLGRRQ
ncbi:MAG: hypothetical protein WA687_04620 [Solirubrobacterales bacterium]